LITGWIGLSSVTTTPGKVSIVEFSLILVILVLLIKIA